MGASFCPACGTPRVGAFRFCRSCQFDFDALTGLAGPVPASSSGKTPGPTVPPPLPPEAAATARSPSLAVFAIAILMVLGTAGAAFVVGEGLSSRSPQRAPAAAEGTSPSGPYPITYAPEVFDCVGEAHTMTWRLPGTTQTTMLRLDIVSGGRVVETHDGPASDGAAALQPDGSYRTEWNANPSAYGECSNPPGTYTMRISEASSGRVVAQGDFTRR